MPKINKILEVYLSLDESLVGGDKIAWPSSFLTCCHDSGRGCRSAVLRGDYYYDATVARRASSSLASSKDRLELVRSLTICMKFRSGRRGSCYGSQDGPAIR